MSRKKEGGRYQPVFMTYGGMVGGVLQNVPALPAAQLTTNSREIFELIVQNDPANAAGNNIYVGNIAGQWIVVRPGESFTIPIGNPSNVYVRSELGAATVRWLAVI